MNSTSPNLCCSFHLGAMEMQTANARDVHDNFIEIQLAAANLKFSEAVQAKETLTEQRLARWASKRRSLIDTAFTGELNEDSTNEEHNRRHWGHYMSKAQQKLFEEVEGRIRRKSIEAKRRQEECEKQSRKIKVELTPEEKRQKRLERARRYQRERICKMSDEENEVRKAVARNRTQLWYWNMSEEQRQRRKGYHREWQRQLSKRVRCENSIASKEPIVNENR